MAVATAEAVEVITQKQPVEVTAGTIPLEDLIGRATQTVLLTGKPREDFIKKYVDRVISRFEDNSDASNVLNVWSNGLGFSTYGTVFANEVLRETGMAERTATPTDWQKMVDTSSLIGSLYTTLALVLVSEDDPNKYLAQTLAQQIRDRQGSVEFPVMIPLAGLDLIKDPNADYGLNFQLSDSAEIIYAPEFSQINKGRAPILVYTRESGLAPLVATKNYLSIACPDLAKSNSDRRIWVSGSEIAMGDIRSLMPPVGYTSNQVGKAFPELKAFAKHPIAKPSTVPEGILSEQTVLYG